MDQGELTLRVAELRVKHPAMFTHAECQEDEVWLGDWGVDGLVVSFNIYRQSLPSLRRGNEILKSLTVAMSKPGGVDVRAADIPVAHYPLFANVYEYVRLDQASTAPQA